MLILFSKNELPFASLRVWNQAKRSLRCYAKQFNFFLQECVFRFNHGAAHEQLKLLKKWRKKYLI